MADFKNGERPGSEGSKGKKGRWSEDRFWGTCAVATFSVAVIVNCVARWWVPAIDNYFLWRVGRSNLATFLWLITIGPPAWGMLPAGVITVPIFVVIWCRHKKRMR